MMVKRSKWYLTTWVVIAPLKMISYSQKSLLYHTLPNPDLNIIERVWGILVTKLKSRPVCTSEEELRVAINEVWKEASSSINFDSLVEDFVRHCVKCINHKGRNDFNALPWPIKLCVGVFGNNTCSDFGQARQLLFYIV